MKWFLRPSSLILVVGLLVLAAAGWIYVRTAPPKKPSAIAILEGEQEIAWLHPATNSDAWRRFVDAIHFHPSISATSDKRSFPDQTTVVPELRIRLSGQRGQLVLRWYKLTSELSTEHWVRELTRRNPPPLAIIGGSNSESAKQLALAMNKHTKSLPPQKKPLLFLTTATADKVKLETGDKVDLIRIYEDRSYRFSFTNKQMCEAVLDFVWKHPRLRPDSLPAYTDYWQDDPYSVDLFNQFLEEMAERDRWVMRLSCFAPQWMHQAGSLASGGSGLHGACALRAQLMTTGPVEIPFGIAFSEGGFTRPNESEARAPQYMLDQLEQRPWQRRPLLFLPAGIKPARRFLRALHRSSPVRARNFVVATGDAINFNGVYRDRNIAWPIQDMPCNLVFFTHHNPIDRSAGFVLPIKERQRWEPESGGTNDLLLYYTIAQSLHASTNIESGRIENAEQLSAQMKRLRWLPGKGVTLQESGVPLFEEGNRRSGTGEHIVWLAPKFRGDRVLPRADLTVYSRNRQKQWIADEQESLKNLPYLGARKQSGK